MPTSLRDGSLPGCVPRDWEQKWHIEPADLFIGMLGTVQTSSATSSEAPPYVPAKPGDARRIIPLGKKLLQTLLEGSRDLRVHTPYSSPKRGPDRHQRADRYLPTTKCLKRAIPPTPHDVKVFYIQYTSRHT
ncbi:hypothetical protein BDV40DRAFT_306863 [Aspergillus tamarii]|uniref:Uncharacterized protein n=1 Tax=Aspergillus tamarii TaxID=41984 RepID=A0A5N6UAH2_ASPTM|nr:hypothetical protein BDV40DRAFT_306863 [Aspergillus tamarii]